MPKFISANYYDNGFEHLKTNGNEINACSAYPTTFAEAHATYMLAQASLDSNDYTISAGDVSGRKIRVAQQADVPIVNSGTVTHIAIVNTATSELIQVTTCSPQALVAGNTVTIPAYDDEIASPA